MNKLTTEQREKIKKIYKDVWDNVIYDTILTDEQRNSKIEMKNIAFEMEDILQRMSADFGLAGLS